MYFSVGLALTAGGVLMAVNPPPPVRSPHTVTWIGVLCAVLGIYLIMKAVRADTNTAQQPTVSAGSRRPPRHAAATSIADSAKECALLLGAAVVGAGFLWRGIAAGLLSVVGIGVIVLGPTLAILAITAIARLRQGHDA
ncbi:hypothetical protein [Mycobacterium sp.]|uniref:hypothetical protein n=1 Tax=Mycobacterium sp. TaxID=1785 RepID=UPI003D14863E